MSLLQIPSNTKFKNLTEKALFYDVTTCQVNPVFGVIFICFKHEKLILA